jgi:hypothetical protein
VSDAVSDVPFVVLARGAVADPGILRRGWDDWQARATARGSGWLGSTAGIAPSGQWAAALRYSSEEDARAARDDVASLLPGATAVELTGDVQVVEGNGAPAVGRFVQVMRARVPDRHRLEDVEAAIGHRFARLRPDFLTGIRAWTAPDRLTVVDWFRSEEEARAGEAAGIPADLGSLFGEWMSLLHDVEWNDLVEPWQAHPAEAP